MADPMGVAVVGCGDISRAYKASLATRPDLVRVVGAHDVRPDAAAAFADGLVGCRVYDDLADLFSDPEVEIVVNLTPHHAHYDVCSASIRAQKHVFTEKPLSVSRRHAQMLVSEASDAGVRLGCAPITWMGEAVQTAWRAIRQGKLGRVRVCYAEMNWARIETWHPAPQPFYGAGVGPLTDVGVYPLAALTAIFGAVGTVSAFGRTVKQRRQTLSGERFQVLSPDIIVAGLEFESGVLARVTASFYVGLTTQHGIEIHGDEGSLHIESAVDFASRVMYKPFGVADAEWEPLPFVREPFRGIEWGRGVFELVEAIREDRRNPADGAHGLHVVDICAAATESAQAGRPTRVMSTFRQPKPMPWAE